MTAAVFIACLLLNISFRSQFFNFDGIACATAIELSDFRHLVHGNHLAYGVLGWLFDRAWRLVGYGGRAILPLQVLDGILGAAGAAVFASLLRRSGRSEREAALGGGALAVSQAWWFWSLEAQVYMLGAVFIALAAREALGEKPDPVLLGLWHAGAVLGHAGHAMALPALAYLLSRRRGRPQLARYLGVLGATVLACYAAAWVFAVRPHTLAELKLWLVGSAALGVDRSFAWHSLPAGASLPEWSRMTLRIFCDFSEMAGLARWASIVLAALPLAAAAAGAARGGLSSRFWLLWLAGYAALYLSWEPATVVYRITDLLALWGLAQLALERRPSIVRNGALACWIAAAFAYNLVFLVRPAADAATNEELTEARWTAAHVPAQAWVLANSRSVLYLPYFEGVRPVNLRYLAPESALEGRLDALAAEGSQVYVTEAMLRRAGVRERLAAYGLEPAFSGEGYTLYHVRRRKPGVETHR